MISVIIPVLNEEENILGFYNSWKAQTYNDFELIFVDDGSTDGTVSLVREISEEDSRVRLIIGPKKGPSYASNLGIAEANGEILFFPGCVAGTHYRDPDCLERVAAFFKDNNVDVVEMPTQRTILGSKKRLYKLYDATMRDPYDTRRLVPVERFYKKDIVKRVGGFDEHLAFGEDRDLFNRIMKLKPRILVSPRRFKVGVYHKSSLREYFRRGVWYGRTIYAFIKKRKNHHKLFLYTTPILFITALIVSLTLKLFLHSLLLGTSLVFGPSIWCIINIRARRLTGLTLSDVPLVFLVWIPLYTVYLGFLYGILGSKRSLSRD